MMTIDELVAWNEAAHAAGMRDAMGGSYLDHQVAVELPDGKLARDRNGHQLFHSQAEHKAMKAARAAATLPVQFSITSTQSTGQLALFS